MNGIIYVLYTDFCSLSMYYGLCQYNIRFIMNSQEPAGTGGTNFYHHSKNIKIFFMKLSFQL